MALTQQFIGKRLRLLDDDLSASQCYELDLRMCNITVLRYDFSVQDDGYRGLPRITKLNASVNELTLLDRGGVQLFPSLTHLDVSVNIIKSVSGLDVLRHLKVVNVSHNHLRTVEWMAGLRNVEEVDLSMNELESLNAMPSLIMLRSLYVNDNKLRSLQGIQALPYLEKLEVMRNAIVDVFPLAASRQLRKLEVSENEVRSLENTTSVLSGLPDLHSVAFAGNPLTEHPSYRQEMMNLRRLATLDGVPLPGHFSLKGSRLPLSHDAFRAPAESKLNIWPNNEEGGELALRKKEIQSLKNQLASLQDELRSHEQKYTTPLNRGYQPRDQRPQPYSVPHTASTWTPKREGDYPLQLSHMDLSDDRTRRAKADYRDITDTDEVLRLASKELAQK